MHILHNHSKVAVALMLTAATLTTGALAQQPGATGSAAIASQPGKAAVVQTVDVSAEIVGIDKATRTISLKGPQGNIVDLVASDEVKKFDQLKVGDVVVRALRRSPHARVEEDHRAESRAPSCARGPRESKPGAQPAGAVARQVSAIVDVTAVDPAKSTITVKGPAGHVTTLPVQNPDQFKVVKVGDHIEVTYTEALAINVEPAAAKK